MPQTNMVNGQVLPVGVTDRNVIAAMLAVPRENFVPTTLKPIAHIDTDLQLKPGLGGSPSRFLMAPGTFAKLLEAARIRSTDTVLDIGCATGYSSAVIAHIGGSVTALECDEELAATATTNLTDLNIENVAVVTGPLERGWPARAPYDVIVMGGSVQNLPDALVPQLEQGGRLVAIIDHGGVSSGHLYIKGPPILICPQHAQTIGMALHELATNSLKHGALSQAAGTLKVRWAGEPDVRWHLEWDENLPEPISTPERKGFGHVVMVDMVERAVNGMVELKFRPEGILWRLDVQPQALA